VTTVDDAVRQLIDDLFETMYAASGIGLAASQVDVHERIMVLDISATKDEPRCFINPEILAQQGSASSDEGCLSVPGVTEPVNRATKIRIRALDRDGRSFELEAEDLLAVCIQHEMDHLDGKLLVDYLSELKRLRIKKKALKQRKRAPMDAPTTKPAY
jgi:peptide deformylase